VPEPRRRVMDTIIDSTARMLVAGTHSPLQDLLQRIAQENMVEVRGDDVVLLAIRLANTGPLRYPPPGQVIPRWPRWRQNGQVLCTCRGHPPETCGERAAKWLDALGARLRRHEGRCCARRCRR